MDLIPLMQVQVTQMEPQIPMHRMIPIVPVLIGQQTRIGMQIQIMMVMEIQTLLLSIVLSQLDM